MTIDVEITVLYFAAASTAVNLTEEQILVPASGFLLSSLAEVLISRHPNTNLDQVLKFSQWSVDAEMVDDPTSVELKGGQEVAIICPVSGGSNLARPDEAEFGRCRSSFLVLRSQVRTTPARMSQFTLSSARRGRSAFAANRLTSTTFLLTEIDDLYSEHPYIYVKVIPSADTVLIVDTGCGGASDRPAQIRSLREFIETVDVADNGGRPLNRKGLLQYIIVLTHCHYDHILGVDQFSDSTILASSHSPSFISTENIAEHSLCNNLKIEVPKYVPKLVPHQTEIYGRNPAKTPLGMKVLHTPGHTPDELAIYDTSERMLYVGDSLYEDEPIIFPKEGSLVEWFRSIDNLINLVRTENKADGKEILINAGHCTALRPAMEVLQSASAFMRDVVEGRERVRKRTSKRGEETVEYRQDGGRFSLICPERLVFEASEE